jgi:hypothetical protein
MMAAADALPSGFRRANRAAIYLCEGLNSAKKCLCRLPFRLCTPLAFSAGSRSSQCSGRINMRSLLSSPLVVVGKGVKLTRNRSVGHILGSAEQSPCCFQIFLASL